MSVTPQRTRPLIIGTDPDCCNPRGVDELEVLAKLTAQGIAGCKHTSDHTRLALDACDWLHDALSDEGAALDDEVFLERCGVKGKVAV